MLLKIKCSIEVSYIKNTICLFHNAYLSFVIFETEWILKKKYMQYITLNPFLDTKYEPINDYKMHFCYLIHDPEK